jgi:hypothetical protein
MLYRFKVKFEDEDDFIAVIETSVKQSFYHLHDIIQEAIGFNKKQEAAIYTSNDNWKPLKEFNIPNNYQELIDKGEVIPSISKFIKDPYQRFLYVADKTNEWILEIELMKIDASNDKEAYPRIVRTEGFPPKQFVADPIADDDEESGLELPLPDQMPDLSTPNDSKSENTSGEFDLNSFPDLGDIDDLDFSDELNE